MKTIDDIHILSIYDFREGLETIQSLFWLGSTRREVQQL